MVSRMNISDLREIGEIRTKYLEYLGFNSIEKVSNAKVEEIINLKIGLSYSVARRTILSAKSMLNKKIYRLVEFKPPKNPNYIDVETTDFIAPECFLIGVFAQVSNDFRQFLICDIKNKIEKRKVENEFMNFMKKLEGTIVTYSQYDIGFLNPIIIRKKPSYDLYTEIKRSFILPVKDYSLKSVANILGYKWKNPEIDGFDIPFLYHEYIESRDESIIKKIIEYNRDDVMSMPYLIEKLRKVEVIDSSDIIPEISTNSVKIPNTKSFDALRKIEMEKEAFEKQKMFDFYDAAKIWKKIGRQDKVEECARLCEMQKYDLEENSKKYFAAEIWAMLNKPSEVKRLALEAEKNGHYSEAISIYIFPLKDEKSAVQLVEKIIKSKKQFNNSKLLMLLEELDAYVRSPELLKKVKDMKNSSKALRQQKNKTIEKLSF